MPLTSSSVFQFLSGFQIFPVVRFDEPNEGYFQFLSGFQTLPSPTATALKLSLSIPFRIPEITIDSNENAYLVNFQFLSGFQFRERK